MDTFAAAEGRCAIRADGRLANFVKERYASWIQGWRPHRGGKESCVRWKPSRSRRVSSAEREWSPGIPGGLINEFI